VSDEKPDRYCSAMQAIATVAHAHRMNAAAFAVLATWAKETGLWPDDMPELLEARRLMMGLSEKFNAAATRLVEAL
jgi:hypothetical protein